MKATIIFIYIAIVAIVILVVHTLSVQRRKKLEAFAKSQGWSFSSSKDKKFFNQYPRFKCLRRGHSRYAYNLMQGSRDGRDITAFDYHYVTGHGKSRKVHNFSALVIQCLLTLKPLYLRPENIFDRVTDFFGYDDIDFESAEFSRQFFVKARDKRWAYDILHQRMIEYLLGAPKFHFQFDVRDIMVWRNERFSEKDFDDAFLLIQGMLSRLPEYVKKQQFENRRSPQKLD
jgi:hypothetical protein